MMPSCNPKSCHADFEYDLINNVLVIYDLDLGNISVTNDIDYVLKTVSQSVSDLPCKKIIYRDSIGVFDGITTNAEGQFLSFYSINEKTLEKAMRKMDQTIAIN